MGASKVLEARQVGAQHMEVASGARSTDVTRALNKAVAAEHMGETSGARSWIATRTL